MGTNLLLERDHGALAGLGIEEAEALHPEPVAASRFQKFPLETGENEVELAARALLCLDCLVHKAPGVYLVVGHGHLLNSLIQRAFDIPMTAKFRFRFGDAGYLVMDHDETKDSWLAREPRPGASA